MQSDAVIPQIDYILCYFWTFSGFLDKTRPKPTPFFQTQTEKMNFWRVLGVGQAHPERCGLSAYIYKLGGMGDQTLTTNAI